MSETVSVSSRGPRAAAPGVAHAVAVDAVLGGLGTQAVGLSSQEAQRRRRLQVTPTAPSRFASVRKLGESLAEPLQLLLIVVGVLSVVFGELRDALAIFVIIALVAVVEAVTEARARNALDALQALSARRASVCRDFALVSIPAAEVVVGDVVVLGAGDVLPGDCRVIEAWGLAMDESALTGEPVGAAKSPTRVDFAAPLAKRSSMLFAGTAVVAGSGHAVVVALGEDTELGQLGRLVDSVQEPRTPLQHAMSELARAALALAIAASVLVPLLGVVRGQPVRQMLLSGLTLAFATIPEELPILVTVLVAVGGVRLARRHVLLRRLRAAETIGSVTVVVTDKTGTLTENRLRLQHVEGDRRQLLAIALAARGGRLSCDPLDLALEASGSGQNEISIPLVTSFPFDPERKRESAVWRDGETVRVCVKGAPESVLAVCEVTGAERAAALAVAAGLAEQGLRVIAVAHRLSDTVPSDVKETERSLVYVGLLGFVDPLRDGVCAAVKALKTAGVRTLVVTGDHPLTAAAVARQAGLDDAEVHIGGVALERLRDADLTGLLDRQLVIARATPADKLRLVSLLQQHGDSVAVTGDGVNDAPALAAADVGVAMGARGTELAREAADLILTDDAYPTVVSAVQGGRGLADQLRRAVAFYLGAKLALVAVIAVPLALGLPSPFAPVQIVLLELFMDLGASVAFVFEPVAPDAMRRAPRDPAARFLDRPELAAIGLTALTLAAATLPAFVLVRPLAGAAAASTAAIVAWLCAHAAIAWTLRTRPRLSLKANPAFPTWALSAAATGLTLALTPLGGAVGLPSLPPSALAIAIGAAVAGALLAAAGQRLLALPSRL